MPPLCRPSAGAFSSVADQMHDPSIGLPIRGVVERQPLAGEHDATAVDARPPVGLRQERLSELLVAVAVLGRGHQSTQNLLGAPFFTP
jgi:hypothetical protein